MLKCEPRKDFGRGFYVTKSKEQAEVWAEKMGDKNNGAGVVTKFVLTLRMRHPNNFNSLRVAYLA